jgi:hypothetical protein
MERAPRSGQMEQGTKDFGERTKLMVKESSGMLTETFSRESGKTIKLMGLEFTPM